MRRRRMERFVTAMAIRPGMRVLDLGGQPEIWDAVAEPLKIVCLNLPGIATEDHPTHHHIEYRVGDGCNMPEFDSGMFDMVFSNSVIEHVGDAAKREQFASEVQRISDTYWVQTPSKFFPIEAHCGMPLWWFYPSSLQQYFIRRWRQKLPEWTEMVEGTTVVTRRELKQLFPGASVSHEWLIFPKSMIVHAS